MAEADCFRGAVRAVVAAAGRLRGRSFRLAGVITVAISAALLLSACGSGSGSDGEDPQVAHGGDFEGTSWTFSNWPLFIDDKTIDQFDRKFDVETKYVEDINDDNEFFSKLQPMLASGKSGDRSAIVLSDWMLKKMDDLGYLQQIDPEAIPTVTRNLVSTLADRGVDPKMEFSVPYQAGMTGLVVDTRSAPDVHSVNDLFDPRYKGRVGFLSQMDQTIPPVLAAMGIDPEEATKDDWLKAIDLLKKQVDSGQIRGFYGNNYITEFASGNLVAGLGYSGDVNMLRKDNPNLEWRMPEQGCVLWTTSYAIPVGAPNPAAALGFLNYIYQPEVAAQIAEYVQYMPPVAGVKEVVARTDPKLAKDPLMFPSEEFVSECFPALLPAGEDETEVKRAFDRMMQG